MNVGAVHVIVFSFRVPFYFSTSLFSNQPKQCHGRFLQETK